MSFIIFLIVLSILIIVHEYGHFAMAKKLGVRVERFAVGFGPKLFAKTFDGTEFAVCLIPLGGYVKMAGDERTSCQGKKDEFYARSPGHRSLIVLMGPVVNYALAFVCFWVVFMIGYPALSPSVGGLMENYPAKAAGFEPKDKILQINDIKIQSWEEVQKYISHSTAPDLNFVILRNGEKITKTLTPRIEILENIFGQKEPIRLVGIKPAEEIILLKYGVVESFVRSWDRLWEITTTTYKAIYRMATGAMSAKDSMTGPVGIFFIIQKASAMGFSYLLYVMGIISASLAIFNLLPFPVLDGGHLFFSAVEKIRRRPLPQKLDETINKIGFSLIITLAVFVFYTDFARLGWIDKILGLWHSIGR